MKLNAKNLAIAAGISWGIYVGAISLIAKETGFATGFVYTLGKLYIGDSPTFIGAILGFLYGFIDAAIGFYIIGYIYNLLSDKK